MKTENIDTQSRTFVPNAAAMDADYSAFKLTDAEYMKIKTVNLDRYRGQFKAAVLKHIKETLGTDEWARLRSMATNTRRHVPGMIHADLYFSAQALVDEWVTEDGISVQETLVPGFKPVQIDQIEGQPVYYVEGRGIYLWGQQPDSNLTLSFWITQPAYPPGW